MKQLVITFAWFLLIVAPFLIGAFYNEGVMSAIFGLWWAASLSVIWYSKIYKNDV